MRVRFTGIRPLAAGSLGLIALLTAVGSAWAGVGDYRCKDAAKVYLGNSRLFQRPAVISSDKVYRRISEYREILEKGLTDKDVRYHFLMKKASAKFKEAVKRMARKKDHDLVAEKGCVRRANKDAPKVPDRTQDVIKQLD